MDNFFFYNPTKIFFGKGEVSKLGELSKEYGKKVLLVYGKSSIKRTGLYDQVMEQLTGAGMQVFEVSGVAPNPRIESVIEGAEICKKENIDLILGVGGGSVIDCSKGIAVAAKYDGDPWDIYSYKYNPTEALPLASILTLAATGTEMNGNTVITKWDTNEKNGWGSYLVYPQFSILDPELTYSVSKYQTACGIVDSLTHVYEFYFSNQINDLNNRMCEGIMKTVIANGPKALANPKDYEARANLMFASTLALNGVSGFGKNWEGYNHTTEHVLSAHWDIAHGAGLAITAAHWMPYILDESTVDKFYEFAVNVWDVEPTGNKFDVAKKGIDRMWDFYKLVEIPMYLKEVGILDPDLDMIATQAMGGNDTIGNFRALSKEDIKAIMKNAL